MRRLGVLAASAGLLATTLAGTPAQAAVTTRLPFCGSVTTGCIESATITPVGGDTVSLDELGLTVAVSSTRSGNDGVTTMRWGVGGWDDATEDVTGGAVQIVISTGTFRPRTTAAVASDLHVGRDDETLTIDGTPARVDWLGGADGDSCDTYGGCGTSDQTADDAGFRFEGETTDNSTSGSLDGAYFWTDAQFHQNAFWSGTDYDDVGWASIASVANPQLTADGSPARYDIGAWLPPGYFEAMSTDAATALGNGFDATASPNGTEVAVPAEVQLDDDGVRVAMRDLGFGVNGAQIVLRNRPSTAPDSTIPDAPEGVDATGDGDEGVVASWTPSEGSDDVNGSGIVGYRARLWTDGSGGTVENSCWVDAAATGDPWDPDADSDSDSDELDDSASCVLGGNTGDTYYVTVSAVNAYGESDQQDRIEVRSGIAAPSPPRGVRVIPGKNQLTVTWLAPLDDGGSPIDFYSVYGAYTSTDHDIDAECLASNPARRTCVLKGLTRPGQFSVAVIANNDGGPSDESDRVLGTPMTVAGAPRAVAARSSSRKVVVSWAAPALTGGVAITGYRADLYTAARGGSVAAKCTTRGLACTTGSLKAGQTYYATVTALNAVGSSAQPARVKVVVKR